MKLPWFRKKIEQRDPYIVTVETAEQYAKWCQAIAEGSTNMDWPSYRDMPIITASTAISWT